MEKLLGMQQNESDKYSIISTDFFDSLAYFGTFSLFAILLSVSTSFLFGFTIGIVTLLFFLFLFCSVLYYFIQHHRWSFLFVLKLTCFWSILIFGCFFVNEIIYDLSWDGQSYHQEALIQLEAGWNPILSKIADTEQHSIWINHYSKGVWYVQSAIYAVTGKIEYAKTLNILLIVISWLLSWTVLVELKKTSLVQSFFIATLCSFNPVAVCQVFSFYVDGQLASCYLILILALFRIHLYCKDIDILLLCAIIIYMANIKFTGLIYCVFVVSVFLAFRCIVGKANEVVHILKFLIPTFIIAVLIVGYNPYVKNFLEHGHPFYPLQGDNAVNIMDGNKPDSLSDKNRLGAAVSSIFGYPSNSLENVKLKNPFSVFGFKDLTKFVDTDVRVSGFGPIFSLIFVLGLSGVPILAICSQWKNINAALVGCIIIAIISTVVINPESWWARYVPQLWLLLILLSFTFLVVENVFLKKLGSAMILIGILNVLLLAGVNWGGNFLMSYRLTEQFKNIKNSSKIIEVYFGAFSPLRVRLDNENINYYEVHQKVDLTCDKPVMLYGSKNIVTYCFQN